MSAILNLNEIISKVSQLDKEEQLNLLERLVIMIRKNEKATISTKLSQISGIGSKIWKNTDIDEYIDHERQW